MTSRQLFPVVCVFAVLSLIGMASVPVAAALDMATPPMAWGMVVGFVLGMFCAFLGVMMNAGWKESTRLKVHSDETWAAFEGEIARNLEREAALFSEVRRHASRHLH